MQQALPPHDNALLNHGYRTVLDHTMSDEMGRERSGRGARCGILPDPGHEIEEMQIGDSSFGRRTEREYIAALCTGSNQLSAEFG